MRNKLYMNRMEQMYLYSLAFIHSPPELNMLLSRFDEFQHFEFSFLTRSFLGGSMVQYVCMCLSYYAWLIQVFHGVAEPAELAVMQCKTLGLVAPDSATWWKMMVFSPCFCQYGCFPRFHPLFWYATTLGGDRWLFKGMLQLESLEMLHMHLKYLIIWM